MRGLWEGGRSPKRAAPDLDLRGTLAWYPILTLRTIMTRATMVTVLNMSNVTLMTIQNTELGYLLL